VTAGTREVANAAWWGFTPGDVTECLQSALDSGATTVIVPYLGSPWIVRTIMLRSDQHIVFEQGVEVVGRRGGYFGVTRCLFEGRDISGLKLTGNAVLRMQKDEFTDGEWRHALALFGCRDVTIDGLTFCGSGGEGIYIGRSRSADGPTHCSNIHIRNVTCTNNRRNGLGVTSVDRLLVEHSLFEGNSGTPPEAGVDLEPNGPDELMRNVVFDHCVFGNNAGPSFTIYMNALNRDSADIDIAVRNCRMLNRLRSVTPVSAGLDDGPRGRVVFEDCVIDCDHGPALTLWDKSVHGPRVILDGCRFRKLTPKTFPGIGVIRFQSSRPEKTRELGGVDFIDCVIEDYVDRPVVAADGVNGGPVKVSDVTGEIRVVSPYPPRMELGPNPVELRVRAGN